MILYKIVVEKKTLKGRVHTSQIKENYSENYVKRVIAQNRTLLSIIFSKPFSLQITAACKNCIFKDLEYRKYAKRYCKGLPMVCAGEPHQARVKAVFCKCGRLRINYSKYQKLLGILYFTLPKR